MKRRYEKFVDSMTEDERLSGYLKKKGDKGLVRGWKLRYFEEKGNRIVYYAMTGAERVQKGSILIDAIMSVDSVTDHPVIFYVTVPGRTYVLQALQEEDKKKWLEGLSKKMARDPNEKLYQQRQKDINMKMMAFEYDETMGTLNSRLGSDSDSSTNNSANNSTTNSNSNSNCFDDTNSAATGATL